MNEKGTYSPSDDKITEENKWLKAKKSITNNLPEIITKTDYYEIKATLRVD